MVVVRTLVSVLLTLSVWLLSCQALQPMNSAQNNKVEHKCHYQMPQQLRYDHVTDVEQHHRMKRQTSATGSGLQANPQPFRLVPIIDSSISQAAAQSIVMPAINYYQQTLQVKYPSQSPISVTQSCSANVQPFANAQTNGSYYCWRQCANFTYCGSFAIPKQYLAPCSFCNGSYSTCTTVPGGNTAISADTIVFIVSLNDNSCSPTSGVAAYGTHCQADPITGRTTVAAINVCPKTISAGSSLNLYGLQHTVLHELTHTIGFSYGMFDTFLMPNGTMIPSNPIVSVMNPWLTASGILYKNTTYLTTPSVVAAARKHFNCTSLPGAELEDQGGPGTALTHWEKRVFTNELMSGIYTDTAYISPLTLSLLQDTGWFVVNFSKVENYTWGQGLGCQFAMESCMSWITSQRTNGGHPYPYCDQFSNHIAWAPGYNDIRTICDPHDNNTVRYCNMQYYSSGSPGAMYQYFNTSVDNVPSTYNPLLLAGGIILADYCPYFEQYTVSIVGSLKTYYMACNDPENGGVNGGRINDLSVFGQGQLCLRQTLPSMAFTTSSASSTAYWGAGCYAVNCSSTAVTVTICNSTFVCSSELQIISWNVSNSVAMSVGQFSCPPCDIACPHTTCPMTRLNYSDYRLIHLNVSTQNQTVLSGQIQSMAHQISHSALPSASSNATSTCPTNITVPTLSYSTTLTTTTTASTSPLSTFRSAVQSIMAAVSANTIYLCPSTCSSNSTCAYIGQPYCRCNYPYYGNGSVSCNQPSLFDQVQLELVITLSNVKNLTHSGPYNQSNTQFLVFDQLFDSILSQFVSTTSYVPTSTLTSSVKFTNSSISVLITTQHSISLTQQSTAKISSVKANSTKAIISFFDSVGSHEKTCSLGYFTANCSSVKVGASSICNFVKCPTHTYCVPYGQLYNCICNSTGYMSIGFSGGNPLVENCLSTNQSLFGNQSGAGVNCTKVSAGTIRCACASGYIGSPKTGCILTHGAKNVTLIGMTLKITASMPASLAASSSLSYWSFILSMEQDLDTAASSTALNGTTYLSGSTTVTAITNGSIQTHYTTAYQSSSGQVNLTALHAAHVSAIQAYYAQAAQTNNGLCYFGNVQAPCAVAVTTSSVCGTSANPCPSGTQCVNEGQTSFSCVCLEGYTQVGVLSGTTNIAICNANAADQVNNSILLAIVLPCVLAVLVAIFAFLVVYRLRWAKKPAETVVVNEKLTELNNAN